MCPELHQRREERHAASGSKVIGLLPGPGCLCQVQCLPPPEKYLPILLFSAETVLISSSCLFLSNRDTAARRHALNARAAFYINVTRSPRQNPPSSSLFQQKHRKPSSVRIPVRLLDLKLLEGRDRAFVPKKNVSPSQRSRAHEECPRPSLSLFH